MMTIDQMIARLTELRDKAYFKGDTNVYTILDPPGDESGIDPIDIDGDHIRVVCTPEGVLDVNPALPMNTFSVSGRCHALRPNNEVVAGPRVDLAHLDLFFADLGRSIAKTPVDNSTEGVEFVFTNSAIVGCGVGKRSGRPEDYVLASVDGIVEACLKREYAASATRYFVRVVRKAPYLRDQYALNHVDEFDRVANESCEFVITEVTTDRDKEFKTLRAKLREAAKSYADTPRWEIEDMLDKDLLWVTVAG